VLGNQRHFQANQKSPIFYELKQIVIKTFGLAFPVREALAPFQKDIRCAFIFGSIAKSTDTVSSDIDLFIMSDTLAYPELVNELVATEMLLGRTINATIYTIADAQERIQSGNAFFNRILEQSKIWLLGDESELPS
jgi:predicted nucleotidyltransferase